MQQHNAELLNSQSNADQQDSSQSSEKKPIFKREHIDGSAVQIITTDEGSFVALGNHRVSEIEDYETIKGKIMSNNMEILLNIVTCAAYMVYKTTTDIEQHLESNKEKP